MATVARAVLGGPLTRLVSRAVLAAQVATVAAPSTEPQEQAAQAAKVEQGRSEVPARMDPKAARVAQVVLAARRWSAALASVVSVAMREQQAQAAQAVAPAQAAMARPAASVASVAPVGTVAMPAPAAPVAQLVCRVPVA